ncbi:MAG: response regulator [Candidatus Brocadiia bacterium]
MTNPLIRVLLIEDDPDDVLLIREMLEESDLARFEVDAAERLSDGVHLLGEDSYDVILLDLSLPDRQGLGSLGAARSAAPRTPIVVLTGLDDQEVALKAVGAGAQDYLIKGQVNSQLLARSMRYAMERQRLEAALEQAAKWERQSRARLQGRRDYRYYVAMARGETSVPSEGGGEGQSAGLSDIGPAVSAEQVERYRDIVRGYVGSDRELEVRPVRQVRAFARELAGSGVGARDIMRMHVQVLNELDQLSGSAELHQLLTDTRLVLVELLANLVEAYREPASGGDDESKDTAAEP